MSEDSPAAGTTQKVILDVIQERSRQVLVEGHTPEKDDRLVDGELSLAAACYVTVSYADDHANGFRRSLLSRFPEDIWPWSGRWWRPGEKRRNLVRAAALIIADIERLDRANAS